MKRIFILLLILIGNLIASGQNTPGVITEISPTASESYVDTEITVVNVALDLKADKASPTFTGTVVLPSTTSIGNVSNTEIGYVDGVTSAIQGQIDSKTTKIEVQNLIDDNELFIGREYLKKYDAAIAKVMYSTSQIKIATIGDSWTFNSQWPNYMANYLQNLYGFAGNGYISFQSAMPIPPGMTRTLSGAEWVENSTGTYGISLAWITSSTPTNSVTITGVATQIVIHYIKKPGGGDFTWAIDGGGATTINTVNATTTMGYVNIPSLSTASHSLVLTVTNAGSTGVTLLGADCQSTQTNNPDGIRLYNIAMTGTTSASWLVQNATLWKDALKNINPDLIIIMLGVNDQINNVIPNTFYDNMRLLIDRIKDTIPDVSIILATQSDIEDVYTYSMSDYVDKMIDISNVDTVALINNYKLIGDYETANANGLYLNATHLNTNGYHLIGKNIIDFLMLNSVIPRSSILYRYTKDFNSLSLGGTDFSTVTTGVDNCFLGYNSGAKITTGANNLGVGIYTLQNTTQSSYSTAIGINSLQAQSTGNYNTAIGYGSLYSKTTAGNNTGIGALSLYSITTMHNNVAIGFNAGRSLTTGDGGNTFIGKDAGYNGSQLATAINSMGLGQEAYTTKNNQIVIGNTSIIETVLRGGIILTPSDIIPIVAATGLTAAMIAYTTLKVIGANEAASDITADPQIVDGTNGQILLIQGSSDAQTVTFDDGTGLALNSNAQAVLGKGDKLCLQYDLTDDIWYELFRSNN